MSIWNPWAEARRLREERDRAESRALRVHIDSARVIEGLTREIRDLEVHLRIVTMERDVALTQLKGALRRDPKTGRLLPKGQ